MQHQLWHKHLTFKLALIKFGIMVFTKILQHLLQDPLQDPLQDSKSFIRDPPYLTLNHGFPFIPLIRPEEIA